MKITIDNINISETLLKRTISLCSSKCLKFFKVCAYNKTRNIFDYLH